MIKCDSTQRTTCKSDEEIDEWLKKKYILVYENQWDYNVNTYGREKRLMPVSRFDFITIDPYHKKQDIREVRIEDVTFHDSLLQIGSLTSDSAKFFSITDGKSRPIWEREDLYMVRYEMSLDKVEHERTVYGILDWLGDVGGLLEALIYISTALLFFIQFFPLEQTLIKKLFSFSDSEDS